ncbi:staphylococcal-like nuclease CAN2 isoform X3 [Manihot esculenta]|uniref:Uncharacterized protein n=1 Tax=Manihot esculenta TaxID=3983 RepID=A0ACB7H1P3_MANES|nr:staphylococcal-like nuclease CAN2 isoform X3 [Manihot esculenta]KAG8644846.1 hypothetical protein MANES_10G007000v8 [Manihot esculenta]
MGNALRFLYQHCHEPTITGDSESLGPHGVSASTVGVPALAQDLFQFETTSQVPEGLGEHVVSSKKAQANWYRKLLEAWREAKPPPKTPEEAARLVIQTLKRHQKADVEVDAKAVSDGDTISVYVNTADPRESSCVPGDVQTAAVQRSKARSEGNYERADALHKKITDSGYRVINVENEEILARKYRIRLSGIDAPESSMPYGKEAKAELVKLVQGKSLRIFVYNEDRYGRSVGDVYCNGIFVQEVMLKKGFAWHYTAYDKRLELASWEKAARAKRVGLWAQSNPEKPWEWRKDKREGR